MARGKTTKVPPLIPYAVESEADTPNRTGAIFPTGSMGEPEVATRCDAMIKRGALPKDFPAGALSYRFAK